MTLMTLSGFAARLTEMAIEVHEESRKGLEAAAVIVETEAKAELGTYQGPAPPFAGWAELADSTKDERIRQGFPENDPLLRDGLLRDNIAHVVEMNGFSGTAYVGVPDKEVQHTYQSKPVNIGEVAEAQELGTPHIPPRTFLGGALVRKEQEVAEEIGTRVVKALVGREVFGGRLPIT